jgi:hypothetical protein
MQHMRSGARRAAGQTRGSLATTSVNVAAAEASIFRSARQSYAQQLTEHDGVRLQHGAAALALRHGQQLDQ